MKKLFNKLGPNGSKSQSPRSSPPPKFVAPPRSVPHPCPHEHIALLVTEDGLLLRPHTPGLVHERHVRIAWGKGTKVEDLEGDGETGHDWSEGAIIYGIVGMLELFTVSYLLVVSARTEVGYLINPTHAVYGVKCVSAIPLVEDRARVAFNTLTSQKAILAHPSLLSSTQVDSPQGLESGSRTQKLDAIPRVAFADEEDVKVMTPTSPSSNLHKPNDIEDESPSPTPSSGRSTPTSPLAKTLADRLSFWSRLSKRMSPMSSEIPPLPSIQLSAMEEQQALDEIISEGKEEPAVVLENILTKTAPPPALEKDRRSELEDKVVRECVREFTKGGMYFAYTFDITRSLQHKQEQVTKSRRKDALLADLTSHDETVYPAVSDKVDVLAEPFSTLPLWRRVDRHFWWNEWMAKPFVDVGLHSYILPIMQGYYQISSFNVPREPVAEEEGDHIVVDYVVVSRRSRDRAGLRYQRRGVDDEAHVANFVETETIMRVEREGCSNVFGYVQIRGSIPLFWTQSSYGLKPPPQLSPNRSHAQNLGALKRHFERTIPIYGPHTIVNLAEHQGKEAAITQHYRDYMQELDLKDAQYNEYDFHSETKGMKYENISRLIAIMERTFEQQGYLWISNESLMSQQNGVFRVNCIDCLDRTNVVQSAFARYVLSKQLGAVALLNCVNEGRTQLDVIFNDVWANNGDAISRAYAGTSALKGDFTRTGKRDLGGLLNDGVNSLARMYTSTFSDWFSQAVIDFVLGYRTLSVFSEFLLKLQSTDPRDLIRLSKIRTEAIATSASRVLSDGERLLSGWTLFAPEGLNTRLGDKFEEKILLLTVQALYVISYDYALGKVKIYTRVPLGDIVSISKGAYILSPLEEASRDPLQNAGFVVTWLNCRQTTRLTSYSVRNSITGETPLSPLPSPTHPKASIPHNRSATSPPSPVNTRNSGLHNRSITSSSPVNPTTTTRRGNFLSKILSQAAWTASGEMTSAAFKALPIDPARVRRASGSGFAESVDELMDAANCKEAVDLMVDAIGHACHDIGNTKKDFIIVADVVSLTEAQRMTSMYAKMEYGVKRLLWLGG